MTPFERTGGETVFEGKTFSVHVDTFRHPDGEEVTREIVRRQGAVAVVAYDDEHVWLVRQPREAIGRADLPELPAGKLDVEGEAPLDAAKRELAEEIGRDAASWDEVAVYYPSSGYTDEEVRIYAATGLTEAADTERDPGERIEIARWPLEDLDGAIAACHDAKTIIGLQWLRARRVAPGRPPA